MIPEEAVPILARWIAELQTELDAERTRNAGLARHVTALEHQVSGFAYWMRVGRTPAHIRSLAAELEEVA